MGESLEKTVIVFEGMSIPLEYLDSKVMPDLKFLSGSDVKTSYEGPVSKISARTITVQNKFYSQGYITYLVRDCDGKDILGSKMFTAQEVNEMALKEKTSGYD